MKYTVEGIPQMDASLISKVGFSRKPGLVLLRVKACKCELSQFYRLDAG